MQIQTKKITIRLEQIDWQDDRFRTSYFADLSQLRESILAIGLVQPPLVQQSGPWQYRIVSGWRRLQILRELKMELIEVLAIKSPDAQLVLFEIALRENSAVRELNLIEKAHVIQKLKQIFHVSTEIILRKYLPFFDLGNNQKWLQWSQLLLAFPEEVQRAFAREDLSFDMIDFLQNLDDRDKIKITEIIKELHLGKNRQKELAILLGDLLRIQNLSLVEFISLDKLQNILVDKKLTYSQKTAKLFEWLKGQRYPAFTAIEKNFLKIVHAFRLPATMQVGHSPFFESDWFTLQMQFRSSKEFQRSVQIQQRLLAEGRIDELFDLDED